MCVCAECGAMLNHTNLTFFLTLIEQMRWKKTNKKNENFHCFHGHISFTPVFMSNTSANWTAWKFNPNNQVWEKKSNEFQVFFQWPPMMAKRFTAKLGPNQMVRFSRNSFSNERNEFKRFIKEMDLSQNLLWKTEINCN